MPHRIVFDQEEADYTFAKAIAGIDLEEKDFDESKHPRDQSGKFSESGGGKDEGSNGNATLSSEDIATEVEFIKAALPKGFIDRLRSDTIGEPQLNFYKDWQSSGDLADTMAFYKVADHSINFIMPSWNRMDQDHREILVAHEHIHALDQFNHYSYNRAVHGAFETDSKNFNQAPTTILDKVMFGHAFSAPEEAVAEIGSRLLVDPQLELKSSQLAVKFMPNVTRELSKIWKEQKII